MPKDRERKELRTIAEPALQEMKERGADWTKSYAAAFQLKSDEAGDMPAYEKAAGDLVDRFPQYRTVGVSDPATGFQNLGRLDAQLRLKGWQPPYSYQQLVQAHEELVESGIVEEKKKHSAIAPSFNEEAAYELPLEELRQRADDQLRKRHGGF